MLFSNFSLKHIFRQFVESYLLSTHKKSGMQTSSLKIFSSFILVFKKFSNFQYLFVYLNQLSGLKFSHFVNLINQGKIQLRYQQLLL